MDALRPFIVNLAQKFAGIPYIWGGSNPHVGFDCSGFCIWVLQVFGVLPSGDWTAQGLASAFTRREATEAAQLGDLVFYGQKSPEAVTHVMMYAGKMNDVDMVVGASGGDHTCTTEEIARLKGAMVKMKPMNYRQDFVAVANISLRV